MLIARVLVYFRSNPIRINKHLLFYSIYQQLESKHVFPSLSDRSYVCCSFRNSNPNSRQKAFLKNQSGIQAAVYTHIHIHTHTRKLQGVTEWLEISTLDAWAVWKITECIQGNSQACSTSIEGWPSQQQQAQPRKSNWNIRIYDNGGWMLNTIH